MQQPQSTLQEMDRANSLPMIGVARREAGNSEPSFRAHSVPTHGTHTCKAPGGVSTSRRPASHGGSHEQNARLLRLVNREVRHKRRRSRPECQERSEDRAPEIASFVPGVHPHVMPRTIDTPLVFHSSVRKLRICQQAIFLMSEAAAPVTEARAARARADALSRRFKAKVSAMGIMLRLLKRVQSVRARNSRSAAIQNGQDGQEGRWFCLLDSVATGSQSLALGAASGALSLSSKGLRRLRCGVSLLDSVAIGSQSLALGAASETLGLSGKGLRRFRCGVSSLGSDASSVAEDLPAVCFPDQPVCSARLKAGRLVSMAFGRRSGRDSCNMGQLPRFGPRRC